jgi:hypothetical protein
MLSMSLIISCLLNENTSKTKENTNDFSKTIYLNAIPLNNIIITLASFLNIKLKDLTLNKNLQFLKGK